MVKWNNKLSNPDAYLIKTGMAWPAANLDVSVAYCILY
jgi:hypothetical protein